MMLEWRYIKIKYYYYYYYSKSEPSECNIFKCTALCSTLSKLGSPQVLTKILIVIVSVQYTFIVISYISYHS